MSARRIAYKNKDGFTLVEMLIAITILLIAATAFLPLMTLNIQSTQNTETRMVASKLADSAIEEIRALDYADVGTYMPDDPDNPDPLNGVYGNPPGKIPQIHNLTLGGIQYTVKALVTWESATGSSNIPTVAAFKKVKITVEAPDVFTGNVVKTIEKYTLQSREGEASISQSGHLRIKLMDYLDNPLLNQAILTKIVNISPTPALYQSMNTDYAGEVLYGIIPAGQYTASVRVPDDMTVCPVLPSGVTYDSANRWLQKNDSVSNWTITVIDQFQIDHPSHIILELYDSTTGQAITATGNLTLIWDPAGSGFKVLDNKPFAPAGFIGGRLPEMYFGDLWPGGTYGIMIDIPGYYSFDTSDGGVIKKISDNSNWNGTFAGPDTTLALRAYLSLYQVFYTEDVKADFDIGNSTLPYTSVAAIDAGSLNLAPIPDITEDFEDTNYNVTVTQMPSGSGATHGWQQTSFDHYSGAYSFESIGRGTYKDSIVNLTFNVEGNNGKVSYYRRVGSYSSTYYKDYFYTYLDNLSNYIERISGNLPWAYKEWTVSKGQHILRLRYKTDGYYNTSPDRGFIDDLEITCTGYKSSGQRTAKPLNLTQFGSVTPSLKISWNSSTPAGTAIVVQTAVNSTPGTVPLDASFSPVANGGNITLPSGSLSGKYLWIREILNTTNSDITPSLDFLQVTY